MRNIFVGLLLVFLDFNLDIGITRVGLIPDFIGYILIYQGLGEISLLSGWFAKVRPFALGMSIYTALTYAGDLLGMWAQQNIWFISVLLGLVSVGVSLYISYGIVMGVKDLEVSEGRRLEGERLYQVWRMLAIFSAITYVLMAVPMLLMVMGVLAFIGAIGAFIVGIVFLVAFNTTKNLYYR